MHTSVQQGCHPQGSVVCDGVVHVVFVTLALGMGIHPKDVNTVVHYRAPQSLEDYFQENGRGGRSGRGAVHSILEAYGLSSEEAANNSQGPSPALPHLILLTEFLVIDLECSCVYT